jgi:DNA-binding transcriptional LysR family regulator
MKNIHTNTTMLRVLDAVAQHRNLTRAAEQLNLTQSGVSHALRAWTQALGAPVVERRGRMTVLTLIGEEVLPDVRTALQSLASISAFAVRSDIEGKLRVVSVASAAASIVPQAIKKMHALYPKSGIELFEGTEQEVADLFKEGIADIAIGMDGTHTQARKLIEVELVAILQTSDALASRAVISVQELVTKPFIMSTSGCESAILDHFHRSKCTLNVVSRIRDTRTIFASVESSLGVTVLPTLSVHSASSELTTRPLDPPLWRNLYLTSKDIGSISTEFVRLLTESCTNTVTR